MTLNRELVVVGEELYLLKRKIRDEQGINVDIWKEHLRAEKVFRKDGILFFCELIPELEILPNETPLQIEKDDTGSNNTDSNVDGVQTGL